MKQEKTMREKLTQWASRIFSALEVELGDDELNRQAVTLNVAILYLFVLTLVQMVAMMSFSDYRPLFTEAGKLTPMPVAIRILSLLMMGMLITDFVAYALVMGRKIREAAILLVAVLTVYTLAGFLLTRVSGGWGLFCLVPILLGVLTVSWRAGSLLAALYSVVYIILLHLSHLGWFENLPGFSPVVRMALEVVNVILSLNFLLIMVGVTLFLLRRSLKEARESQRLSRVLSDALEWRLHEQEEVRKMLEAAVERYADFLVQASAGQEIELLQVEDVVGEQLTTGEVAQVVALSLRRLGEAINETVLRLWSLLRESEEARRDADAARRRYVRRAWREYLQERKRTHVVEEGEPLDETLLQRAVESAVDWHGVAIEREEKMDALAVPIAVGEQIIGVMTLQQAVDSPSSRWTDEERRFAALVADRLSTALNTLRLLDETQRREARERFISQFTARLRSAATVEEALSDAMQTLRQVFGAEEVVTHLQVRLEEGEE